ncbi:MAG: EAL domain-containing protein, partial [Actinobacteria bacterium]|nr:EAL domain-containing protein [Actinomycetota bacterium]
MAFVASEPFITRQLNRLSRHTTWAQTTAAFWLIGALALGSIGAAGLGAARHYSAAQASTSLDWLGMSRERLDLLRSVEDMEQDLAAGKSPAAAVAGYVERRDRQVAKLRELEVDDGEIARAADATIGAANAVPAPENPSTFGVHVSALLISVQGGALARQTPLEGELAFPDNLMVELARLQAMSAMLMSLRDAAPSDDMLMLIGSANASSLFPIQGPVGTAFTPEAVPEQFRVELEQWLDSEDTHAVTNGVETVLKSTSLEGLTVQSLNDLHTSVNRSIVTLTGLSQAALAAIGQDLEGQIENSATSGSRWLYTSVGLAVAVAVVMTLRQNRMRQAAVDLRLAASTDGLTGLSNRGHLEAYVCALRERDSEVVLMHVDLDHFKPVNDTYGHAVGDRVLQLAAERLREVAFEYDGLAARLGGDEFVVVFSVLDSADVERVSQRLVDSLISYSVGGLDITVGASIGVARGNDTLHELLIDADLALYQAKRTGRGQAATFQDEAAAFVDFVRQEVTEGRVQAVFQPQFSLRDGRCVGAEVYARLVDRNGTLLQADEWMGVVEWMGWTAKLFEHLVTAVAAEVAAAGNLPPKLWINVSPSDLVRPGGGDWVLSNLRRLGLPPDSVGIELTNPESITDLTALACALHEVRSAGYGVALDDFGRLNAPLGHLRDLPVSRVKLDKGLVGQVTPEMLPSAWIVRALSDLARQLRIEVVAEGVSSGHQLELLAKLGIPTAQGYLLGLPGGLERLPLGMNLRQLVGVSLDDLERRASGGLIAPTSSNPGDPTYGNDRRTIVRNGDDRRLRTDGEAPAAGA